MVFNRKGERKPGEEQREECRKGIEYITEFRTPSNVGHKH